MKSVCFQHYGISSVIYWSWSNFSAYIAVSLFRVNEARGGHVLMFRKFQELCTLL